MSETVLEVLELTKSYGEKEVLHPLSFSVKRGEILAIIGPSGAGKSTLIRLLDGLETPSSGNIRVFGKSLHRRKKRMLQKRMGVLFQKTVLFDRSVEDNVALGLSYRRIPRAERAERVSEVLSRMGMAEYAKRRAKTLSGGEGQRVAFARVLVTQPEIIFLDEPTANLDPLATSVLEEMILEENRRNNTTIILNTHDQLQGQRLADRMLVLMDGKVVQEGTPDEVFYAPKTVETAKFVGVQNIFSAVVKGGSAVAGGVSFAKTAELEGSAVFAMLRAEDVRVSKDTAAANTVGRVLSVERRGAFVEMRVLAGQEFIVRQAFREFEGGVSVGDEVGLFWDAEAVCVCAA